MLGGLSLAVPFQGLLKLPIALPRALPWADLFCPLQGEETSSWIIS